MFKVPSGNSSHRSHPEPSLSFSSKDLDLDMVFGVRGAKNKGKYTRRTVVRKSYCSKPNSTRTAWNVRYF